jgi:hypothetical protein
MILGKYPVKWVAAIGGGLLLFLLLILVIVIFKGNSSPSYNPGEGFVIPKGGDPYDLSFLEGCWESKTDLVNAKTKMPITHVYCINDKGTGTFTLKEFNTSGRHIDTCTAGVTASREGDIVVIKDRGAVCGDGKEYNANTLRCGSGPRKTTQCKGKTSAGSTFDATYAYQGKN